MITNLSEVPADIVGGHQIDVVPQNIRNARVHSCLEQMARLMLFLLECDSNNTSSKIKPSDVRFVREQWDICKSEFEFNTAEENNDLPEDQYEHAYSISLPHQKELARIRNVKIKRVATEVWRCMNVCLSCDSSNTQGFTDEHDKASMTTVMEYCDRVMDRWIGNGSDFTDVGLKAPAYEILGQVLPDVDSDFARKLEPSKKLPDPRLPDTPDTAD